MANFYSKHDKHYVALDCIIFGFEDGELKLLLLKRKFEPCKGEWSLMGGFLKTTESLDDGARRILHQLTGLHNIYMEQLHTFGDVNRDSGERTISVTYYALIKVDENDRKLAEAHGAQWISITKVPKLIFDHNDMVNKALSTLRSKIVRKPIGFELLPEKFTLPQLQNLYEAINQQQLDKRNFRKRILDIGLLDKMPEKEKESSKKGAYYYKFNKEKYLLYTEMGQLFHFKVKKDPLIKVTSSEEFDK
ncbi:MAG TPA: NUDIX domain-containing protein [Bacteroidales bacterium]|nr:NUDIX domain-containing protein [Bacteroidales bacterium]